MRPQWPLESRLVDVIPPAYWTLVQYGPPRPPDGSLAGRGIVMGRDEDDRDARPVRRQAFLKLEPAHSVKVDVEAEAGRSTQSRPLPDLG